MVEYAKVIRSGNAQAVRLPEAFRLDVGEVEISREGETIVLRPRAGSDRRWAGLHAAVVRGFSDDFEMSQTADPAGEQDRPGLDDVFR